MHFETENRAALENPHDVVNDVNDEPFYAMSGRTKQSVYRSQIHQHIQQIDPSRKASYLYSGGVQSKHWLK
jgi:hypothetical protein